MNVVYLLGILGASYGLPSGLLESVCTVESGLRSEVVRKHDGAGHSWGLCQIKESTAKQMGFEGSADELLDPSINGKYSALYLMHQYKRYGDWQRAITAYNKGHSKGDETIYYGKVKHVCRTQFKKQCSSQW